MINWTALLNLYKLSSSQWFLNKIVLMTMRKQKCLQKCEQMFHFSELIFSEYFQQKVIYFLFITSFKHLYISYTRKKNVPSGRYEERILVELSLLSKYKLIILFNDWIIYTFEWKKMIKYDLNRRWVFGRTLQCQRVQQMLSVSLMIF